MKLPSAHACFHCGESCQEDVIRYAEKSFCCEGCKQVYALLHEHDLCQYYELDPLPGKSMTRIPRQDQYAFLDLPEIQAQLLDYIDDEVAHVRVHLPQIHCTSCIWLLENVHRLHPGLVQGEVNFLQKTLYLRFDPKQITLRTAAELLAQIGYAPSIQLDRAEKTATKKDKRFALRLGVAGFCFGNIMLLSFPEYLGMEADDSFRVFFSWLNLFLSLPVLIYSSRDFFRSAWLGLRHRNLNLDIPISLGILVLFARSAYEVMSGWGVGYFDSLAGLVFLLLVGKWFQRRTFDGLDFDRDYRAYFPLSAFLVEKNETRPVSISDLKVGDCIRVHHGELIPADGSLLSESADIDYSFVNGESQPISLGQGAQLFAGGRQLGGAIDLKLSKTVCQSYLTQLWNHPSFQKTENASLSLWADRVSRYFTPAILLIAGLTGLYWAWQVDMAAAVNVFTAVLIVACPCALALCAPILLGSSMRYLGRAHLYLKNTQVLERMSQLSHLVFDKTGTLTPTQAPSRTAAPDWPSELIPRVSALVSQSMHPVSQRIAAWLGPQPHLEVKDFVESPGQGIAAWVEGHFLKIGRKNFVDAHLIEPGTWVSQDGVLYGECATAESFRPGLPALIEALAPNYNMSLLSGDNDHAREELADVFPEGTPLHFQQSPSDKLAYVAQLQVQGEKVLMLGDGLNDAGALQQSEVGIAISESVHGFSPACDAILDANELQRLPNFLAFARQNRQALRGGFVLSLAYNLIGLSFAMQGLLTPIIAAVLMPLSSLSMVAYGLLVSACLAKGHGLMLPQTDKSHPSPSLRSSSSLPSGATFEPSLTPLI